MAGSLDLPLSADECMTLPDRSNVYGDFDEYPTYKPNGDIVFYTNDFTTNPPSLREERVARFVNAPTPRSTDPPQSEYNTARTQQSPPQNKIPAVPTDITIPTTTATVASAPMTQPTKQPIKTPQTTNKQHQHSSQASQRSRDPPEEGVFNDQNSAMLLSYATASVASPPQTINKGRSVVSVHSQSSISSPPPPTAPPQTQTNSSARKLK